MDELVLGVRLALGEAQGEVCGAWALKPGERVRVEMLISAITSSLNGCIVPAQPTATRTSLPVLTPTSPGPPTFSTPSVTATASATPTASDTETVPLPPSSPSPTPAASPVEPFLRAYVANTDSNTVSVVDLLRREVIGTIEGFDHPVAVTSRPDGRFVYVVNRGSGSLAVVDTIAGRTIAEVPVGMEPRGVDVTSDGMLAFVSARTAEGDVTIVDLEELAAIDAVALSTAGGVLKVHPNQRKVYVAAADQVVVFRIDTHEVLARVPFPTTATVTDIEFIPGGDFCFAVTSPDNEGGVISGTSDNLLGTFRLGIQGKGAEGIGDIPFTNLLFAVEGAEGRIDVIERSKGARVVDRIRVDGIPVDVVAPDSFSAFVIVKDPDGGEGWLAVLNPVTSMREQTIGPLGRGPSAIAITRFDGDDTPAPTPPTFVATTTGTATPSSTPTGTATLTSTYIQVPTHTPTCRPPSVPVEVGTGRLTSSANVGSNEVELIELRVGFDAVDACAVYRARASLSVVSSPPCSEPGCERFVTARIASDTGGGSERSVEVSTNLNQPSTVVVEAEFAGLTPGPHWISVFVTPNSSGPTFFSVPSSLRVTAE